MRWHEYIVILLLLSFWACSPKTVWTSMAIDQLNLEKRSGNNQCCRDSDNYNAGENDKLIRVVFHYMYDSLGNHNLDSAQAIEFAHQLLKACNEKLEQDIAPNLTDSLPLPALNEGYQYRLTPATDDSDDTGIYFHNDQALYYFLAYGKDINNYDRKVIKKYQVKKDSFLNIFMMPHHPDSAASATYNPRRTGIALGTSVKVAGYFAKKLRPIDFSGLVNHEIGHVLGLSHTWNANDGCDDTPKHENCWNYTEEPPCDSLISNNMMDYNAYQNALTPCQIGRISRNLTRWRARQRKLVIPDWCQKTDTIYIEGDEIWEVEKDISADIIVKSGASLTIKCRLAMPESGNIHIHPDGKLILDNAWLHNSCGKQWNGIQLGNLDEQMGLVEIIGKVTIDDVIHGGNSTEDD